MKTRHWLQTAPLWALSLSTGLLAGLAFFKWAVPLVFVAFVPLLALAERVLAEPGKRPNLKVYGHTFLAIVVWNTVAYWWLWNASGWATLAAWIANALLQSLPVLFWFVARRASSGRFGQFSFAVFWMAFEYLHLHWDFSWVWLNLGNVFGYWPAWVQWYEHTGFFGGTLWVLMANILLFRWMWAGKRLMPALAVLLLPLAFSYIRFFTYQEQGYPLEAVAVQPNLDCYTEKFEYNAKTGTTNVGTYVSNEDQLARFLRLSAEAVTDTTAFLFWPETAMHEGFQEPEIKGYASVMEISRFTASRPGLSLVTGIDAYRSYGNEKKTRTARNYRNQGLYYDVFNAALFVGEGRDPEIYHKSRLVIGAETIPFPEVLGPMILNFGGSAGSHGVQDTAQVFFNQKGEGVAPIICYESVYGEYVAEFVRKGAGFLTIITNDGWWGDTPGHVQHLVFGALRAIETRRDIARSANTGISCFINQKGEMLQPLAYGETGAVRGTVRYHTGLTFYVRMGDYLGRLAAFLAVAMFLAALVKGKLLSGLPKSAPATNGKAPKA